MRRAIKTSTIALFLLLILLQQANSCTIVSAIDKNGQVWNLNNEDGPYGVANFINIFPKTANTKFGYYTLSYLSPELGKGGSIQGGTNEAGLTFDFNAIDRVTDFDPKTKKAFPEGDNAILPHILANMSTVEEVIDFFSTYWFQNGFTSAQMHVADKQGRFAIISASGIKLQEKGKQLVSTNFDICGNESSASCWRYPIAVEKVEKEDVNLLSMMAIALETRQKNGSTMYTNIQNLSTGEVWFFSKHDPNVIVNTDIKALLERGRKSFTFNDLKSFTEERSVYVYEQPIPVKPTEKGLSEYHGKYNNFFIGDVIVKAQADGLEISFDDGSKAVFQPIAKDQFAIMDADVRIKFHFDKLGYKKRMSLYENGFWSFTAWVID